MVIEASKPRYLLLGYFADDTSQVNHYVSTTMSVKVGRLRTAEMRRVSSGDKLVLHSAIETLGKAYIMSMCIRRWYSIGNGQVIGCNTINSPWLYCAVTEIC